MSDSWAGKETGEHSDVQVLSTLMRSPTKSFKMGIQSVMFVVLAFLQLPKHWTGQNELSLVSIVNQPRSSIRVTYIPPKRTKPKSGKQTITKWPENATTYSIGRPKWAKGEINSFWMIYAEPGLKIWLSDSDTSGARIVEGSALAALLRGDVYKVSTALASLHTGP